MTNRCSTFRSRLRAGEQLIGSFIKTPSSIVAEVLALSDLDVVCIDAEHAPFGRLEIDQCIAALRAADCPSLVRIPNDSPSEILNALDCGATGILVPHVKSAEQAAAIAKATRFGDGGRGYAGSSRAAGYTTKKMPAHIADSAEETTLIVQIEDLAALDCVAEIAAIPEVDAIFVGRIDLAVAMSCSPMDAEVISTVQRICEEAHDVDAAVGMFTPDYSEIAMWQERGTSLFLLGSDHNMLLSGASDLASLVK